MVPMIVTMVMLCDNDSAADDGSNHMLSPGNAIVFTTFELMIACFRRSMMRRDTVTVVVAHMKLCRWMRRGWKEAIIKISNVICEDMKDANETSSLHSEVDGISRRENRS